MFCLELCTIFSWHFSLFQEKEYGLKERFDAADGSINDVYTLDDISIQKFGKADYDKVLFFISLY